MLNILGISAFYHDCAAALVVDGEIVAAAQEERFTRIKHDPGFPRTRSGTVCGRPASLPPTSTMSPSTKSHSSSSTASGDLSRLRPRRLSQLRRAMPSG